MTEINTVRVRILSFMKDRFSLLASREIQLAVWVHYFAVLSVLQVGCISSGQKQSGQEKAVSMAPGQVVFREPDPSGFSGAVSFVPAGQISFKSRVPVSAVLAGVETRLNALTQDETLAFQKSLESFKRGDIAQSLLWMRRSWSSATGRMGLSFEENIGTDPLRSMAIHFGSLLLATSDYREGERVFQQVISAKSGDPAPYLSLCGHYLERSEFLLAERVGKSGIAAVMTNEPGLHECYASSLLEQKRYEETLVAVRNARNLFPEDKNLVSLLATVRWKQGDRIEACELFKIALGTSRNSAREIYNQALCLFESDELQDARLLLEAAFVESSFDPSIRYLLGQVYYSEGEFSMAETQWQEFLRQSKSSDKRREIVELALVNLRKR